MKRNSQFLAGLAVLLSTTAAIQILHADGGAVAQNSPAGASSGAPYVPPSGNYPGTGSSPQRGVSAPELAPSPATPAADSAGAPRTPPTGAYKGSGSSPQPGVVYPQLQSSPPTPGAASAGAMKTPLNGVTPGTGTSPQ